MGQFHAGAIIQTLGWWWGWVDSDGERVVHKVKSQKTEIATECTELSSKYSSLYIT